ncbi:MAG: hypothetical protein HKL85_11010, partial [Acidimicrobiaceae bacterium]|nr:hypothetical protein [Acidimicrobiaceae bacterium]
LPAPVTTTRPAPVTTTRPAPVTTTIAASRPTLPYVGTNYGTADGPPPPARVITDGFLSCTFPNDVYYYVKYSNGYSQISQVHYTKVGSVDWIAVDTWGSQLPYAMFVSYTASMPPTGIHYGGTAPGCTYWKAY